MDRQAVREADAQADRPRWIDIEVEAPLSMSEAAKRVPKVDGKKVHASTVFRWCKRGLKGVRLEHIRIGRQMATSAEALSRFFNALAVADGDPPVHRHAPARERSPSQTARARDIAQAEAALENDGP